jgi:hypothetical protein
MKVLTGQGRAFLLAALMVGAVFFALPCATYAQFGALGNMAKGKALEALTNKVMKELEKKFADALAKEPISEAAKAEAVNKLSDMARPTVKRFIDGAASGKLPNPIELAQTVLKDILPHIPEVVAAAKGGGGGTVVASGAPAAPLAQGAASAAVPGQQPLPMHERPKLAVYVFGADDPSLNKALVSRLITALSNSGRYQAADNYREFFESAVEEQGKDSASSMKKEQIKTLGEQFGADYLCVAEITAALGEKQVSAHILDVKTAEITATGVADISLKTSADLTVASEQIAETMFRNAAPPAVRVAAVTAPPPAEEAPPPPPEPPAQPVEETSASLPLADVGGAEETTAPRRRARNGLALGYVFSGKDVTLFQLGFAQVRPITENAVSLSFAWEIDIWGGYGENYGENYGYDYYRGFYDYYYYGGHFILGGAKIPLLFQLDWSIFSVEAGAQADYLYKVYTDGPSDGNGGGMFNAGGVLGWGVSYGKNRMFRNYYRLVYGIKYNSQEIAWRVLF